jgi:hypothetical protein
MNRRRYLAGLALATGLAGCSDAAFRDPDDEETPTSSSSTGTPTSESESDSGDGTPTDGSTPAETATDSNTPDQSSGDFQPTISFENCARVVVDAPAYDTVALHFKDIVQRFDKGYEGEDDFRGRGDYTGKIIWKVSVTHDGDTASRKNPDLSSCRS